MKEREKWRRVRKMNNRRCTKKIRKKEGRRRKNGGE